MSKLGVGGQDVWDKEGTDVIGLDEPAKLVVVDVDNEAVDAGVSGGGRLLFVDCSLSSSNDRSSSLTCIFCIFFCKSLASISQTFNEEKEAK